MTSDDPNHDGRPRLERLSTEERRDLAGVGFLAICWALVPAGLGFWLLARLGTISAWFESVTETRGLAVAILVYAAFFAVTSGLGLLPTYAQAILGGWIFGSLFGTVGAMAGILMGSSLGWLLARLVSGPRVNAIIERRPSVNAVRKALVGSGFWRSTGIIALLRLSPNSPFALSNLALGGSGAGFGATFMGTAAGMLPRTALAAVVAAAARTEGSRGLGDVVRERGPVVTVVGVVVLLVVMYVIARIARSALQRVVPGSTVDS